jgi:hypothetical protein
MVEAEIKADMTDYKGGIVSKSLRFLCQEGKIHRQGLGKKGNPYLYASVKQNAGDSRDSYIEIPTIPIIASSLKNDPLPKVENTLNPEAVLGMPVEKAIEVWQSAGAPIIHLGAGKNCQDLAKLLSNPCNERLLEVVKAWLQKRITSS